MSATDFSRILRELRSEEVEFIVVGGVGAALQGAPITTQDLDIVHRRTPENIERLVRVLTRLKARYRTRPDLHVSPERSALESDGHHLLQTDAGALDVLGRLVGRLTYEDLLPRSHSYQLEGMSIRVQDLESLIEVKEELGEEKDLAMLPILRRTLEERRGG